MKNFNKNYSNENGISDRQELRILHKRLESKRWVVPDEQRTEMPERVVEIMRRSEDARVVLLAARILAMLEGQNQKDDHVAVDLKAKAAGLTDQPPIMFVIKQAEEPRDRDFFADD